jgi:hypothetical protein
MRDLGTMGESTFSLWCADSGLVANGSLIDKTGWDYFVEFPFNSNLEADEIHQSAIECKVQVKATDDDKGKVSISLSNLRKLITAQMPSFFVFIEFGGKPIAQKGYVVHVDNELISKVLKRLHEIEQSDLENNYNKRTMTIRYNNSHLMSNLGGKCLKELFLSYIGNDMAKYVAEKKAHLESTGFENGFAQISFIIQGEYNIKQLIDVSLGLEKTVSVKSFKGTKTRFGISSKSPFIDGVDGKLEILNLKPNTEGEIRFKEDQLSLGYTFPAKMYLSPFTVTMPQNLVKARIEGEFFDLKFNPFTGESEISFSLGEGVRLEIKKYRDALKLLSLFCTPGKRLYSELIFDNFRNLNFYTECHGHEFLFSKELLALDAACNILSYFRVADEVDTSLNEISKFSDSICVFDSLISATKKQFRVDFEVEDEKYNPHKETACVKLTSTQIGSHIFGVFVVIKGDVKINETGKYELVSSNGTIEKKIVSKRDSIIDKNDLYSAIKPIEEKYLKDYQVVVIQQ